MSMSNDPNIDMEAMQAQILQSLNRESQPTKTNSSEASVLKFLENMDPHDAEVVQANLRNMPME